jgi:DNA adenine methylase
MTTFTENTFKYIASLRYDHDAEYNDITNDLEEKWVLEGREFIKTHLKIISEIPYMSDISNINCAIEDIDLTKLTRAELLVKCDECGVTKCKTKNKSELIDLINKKNFEGKTTEENIIKEPILNNISPLRYPGGKTRACKIIDNIITEHFDITQFHTLCSPFFGGGSFEFYFQNKYNHKLIVNDKFTPLYNFWKQIKTNKNILYNELSKITSVSKEQFTNYRNTIMELNDNILQQSLQYFIINRCSFSGATLSGGFSEEASLKRYTPSSINKIKLLDFKNIDIYNFDFEYFIDNFTNEKTLMFLDPPYYLEKQSKLYGNNGDMHENFNHQLLYDLIKTKQKWLITYNNCEYIKKLYKDYLIIDVNWSYGMNKSKTSSEIIIISK